MGLLRKLERERDKANKVLFCFIFFPVGIERSTFGYCEGCKRK